MDDLKESLKKMGWDDKLINHYVGKEFKTIKTSAVVELKPIFTETHSIIIDSH